MDDGVLALLAICRVRTSRGAVFCERWTKSFCKRFGKALDCRYADRSLRKSYDDAVVGLKAGCSMAKTFAGFGIASSRPPIEAIMFSSTLSPGRKSSVLKPLQWPGCFVDVVGRLPGRSGSKGACSVAPFNNARRDDMLRFFWFLSEAVEGRGAFFRERRGRCL